MYSEYVVIGHGISSINVFCQMSLVVRNSISTPYATNTVESSGLRVHASSWILGILGLPW